MDPFAAYAKRANSIVNQPARLVGPIKLRADARLRYGEIVAAMNAAHASNELEQYLQGIGPEVRQFRAELEFLWSGDNEFLGLEREIERARARVDDGLDFPRWENRGPDTQVGA